MLGKIRDLNLRWFTTVRDNHLVVSQHKQREVNFIGEANSLILIATRKEELDILSFLSCCRLCITGDTESGLYVGNCVDAITLKPMSMSMSMSMPIALRTGLLRLVEYIKVSLPEGAEHARLSC
ncbi:ubiquinone anaerobic biosynthesis accessory factor UbiT [Photorhabdus viridis]|uniref:ubiquinone anaerobic biosynthesis accessory factor UbiT n=1 Tax=Photorhabdus viridis TaxID=3163327 RepID=UPI00330780CF